MMGEQKQERVLFSYAINLEKRVRSEHPLRRVAAVLDFSFVRQEVAHCYGTKGNVSVDPEVILKLMFLLFFDDISSERELMKMVPERLDYLWFLGYGLEDEIPGHSILSKARARWGKEVFERLFVKTISQCLAAGLVDGRKLHLDSSLIQAHASKESVIKGAPELIAALKRAYQVTQSKLEEEVTSYYKPVNECLVSKTDPDAAMMRRGRGDSSRPRYHHHRAIDDQKGVITAIETTTGSVAENHKLIDLVEQHEANTSTRVEVTVADQKYGTQENYVACAERGITSHMGDFSQGQTNNHRCRGIYPESAFSYEAAPNTYRCPAGETLSPRRLHPLRRTMEYAARPGVCARCLFRRQCTRAKLGRTVKRHEKQGLLDVARGQAHSAAAERDRRRRRHLMEGSFADASNNHHFKRARWRRLWRQQIQDYLIAACQNVRILLRHGGEGRMANLLALPGPKDTSSKSYFSSLKAKLRSLWFYCTTAQLGSHVLQLKTT